MPRVQDEISTFGKSSIQQARVAKNKIMAKKLLLLVKTKGKTKAELRKETERVLRKKGLLAKDGKVKNQKQ